MNAIYSTRHGMVIHSDLIQGSDEWLAARCGLLTASEMHLILTPTLKVASNDKTRQHLYELLAQRITRYVEPRYVGEEMLRGQVDEVEAKIIYSETYAPVEDVGFITNDKWGFTLGYSPDGLVGGDGLIECKSRRQKYQVQTILAGSMPEDYLLQIQTGLLVTGRSWCDFVSYSGGLPMLTIRVYPNAEVQNAILTAAQAFETKLSENMRDYMAEMERRVLRLVPTERRVEQEMYI
jgi:predicted phage-related endonuclease